MNTFEHSSTNSFPCLCYHPSIHPSIPSPGRRERHSDNEWTMAGWQDHQDQLGQWQGQYDHPRQEQQWCFLSFSILLCSILSYSVIFYPTLFYSILLCSILSYSVLFYPTLFYSLLLCSILSYFLLLSPSSILL